MKCSFTELVKAAAMGQWDYVLQQTCGMSPKQTTPTKKGMPCPNCGGHDRFEFKSAENGYYMCRGCGAGDGFSMIIKMCECSFSEAVMLVADGLGIAKHSGTSSFDIESKKRELQAAEEERQAVVVQNEYKAAVRAKEVFNTASYPSSDFPYLVNKHVKAHGIKQLGNEIIIPIRDAGGKIMSIQYINANGGKRFLPGGRTKGGFHLMGSVKDIVYISEGYATSASSYEYSFRPVAVAFYAGNLEPVAIALRTRYPLAHIIILADNDRFTVGNPGIEKALKAAKAVGGEVKIPQFRDDQPGTDYNDWINAHRGLL